MAKRISLDRWLFTVTLFLVFAGLVMVFSASRRDGKGALRLPLHFSSQTGGWAVAGLLTMLAGMKSITADTKTLRLFSRC